MTAVSVNTNGEDCSSPFVFVVADATKSLVALKAFLSFWIPKGYSRQLSSNIMSMNPMAKPIVPMLLCLPFCDDGMSSSTTT